jgi:FixJ family two-component response regulator
MPIMAAALARLYPALPIVFMSGFTAQLMDMHLVSPDLVLLAKPFRNDELLMTVRRHLGATDSQGEGQLYRLCGRDQK